MNALSPENLERLRGGVYKWLVEWYGDVGRRMEASHALATLAPTVAAMLAEVEERGFVQTAQADARRQVKEAVEEWFRGISLDDLFIVKGWNEESDQGEEQTPAATRSGPGAQTALAYALGSAEGWRSAGRTVRAFDQDQRTWSKAFDRETCRTLADALDAGAASAQARADGQVQTSQSQGVCLACGESRHLHDLSGTVFPCPTSDACRYAASCFPCRLAMHTDEFAAALAFARDHDGDKSDATHTAQGNEEGA